MKFKDIKDTPAKELMLKLRQNRAEQMELRKKKSAGTLEKSHEIRLLRRDAARILTALNQKGGIAAAETPKVPATKEAKREVKKADKAPKKFTKKKATK